MNEIKNCPLCGCAELPVVHRSAPAPDRLHAAQARCRGCGLLFAQPMATDAVLAEYYGKQYYRQRKYDDWNSIFAAYLEAYRRDEWPLLERLWADRPPPPGGRVAEVGCGMGVILDLFKERGFATAGCDLGEQSVAWCRRRGHDVALAPCPGSNLPPRSFDVACACQVIEHMLDVRAFARELVGLAKPGGLVVVTSEPITNWERRWQAAKARLRGRLPPYHTSSEHTVLFDPPQLRRLLEEAGCRDVKVECYNRTPAKESWHWALRRNVFRTANRLCGYGDCIMAVARAPE